LIWPLRLVLGMAMVLTERRAWLRVEVELQGGGVAARSSVGVDGGLCQSVRRSGAKVWITSIVGGRRMDQRVDPSASALLILHYQNGLVRHEGVFAFSGTPVQIEKHNCLEKTAAVLWASRDAGVTVIYVNIAFRPGFPELRKPTYPLIESIQERNAFLRDSWDAAVPDELKPEPTDLIVINFDSSAFSHTDLDGILRAKGIRDLFLAGIATNWIVESTARYGAELGYAITVLEDCCQGFSDELHDFAITKTLPYYASIATSTDFVARLSAPSEATASAG
jgi:ureidoacrylate peracid hydrolase